MSDWETFYARLKDRDPAAYRKAMEYSEMFTLQYNLPAKAAAELETSFVMFALEVTGGLAGEPK